MLDGVKAAVCANVNLFMEVAEEEFEKYLTTFANDVWQLLVKVSPAPGQDHLAMAALRFLTTLAHSVHAKLFGDAATLKQICESIVIPNLCLRAEDEELFECNPVDFIRRDAEGSDADTRRRAAADLVRALCDAYEAGVTELCTGYVSAMLAEYAAAPATAWKAKDCALSLVMALAVKGKTGARGATTTNRFVDVAAFYARHVLPELAVGGGGAAAGSAAGGGNVDALPMLKADALKFATLFRSQLPVPAALALLPHLIALLARCERVC